MHNINWKQLNDRLPSEKTEEAKHKRDLLWKGFDVNGNGIVSLAEVDKGLRDVLNCVQVFDCKPVIIQAFNAAKNAVKSSKAHSGDYVDRAEFRLLLAYLKQYFAYYQIFCEIDTGNDRRINRSEFSKAKHAFEQWVGPIEDVNKVFDEIDANGGGEILFGEFVAWATKKNLDTEDYSQI